MSDDNNRPTTFTQLIHHLVRLAQISAAGRFVPVQRVTLLTRKLSPVHPGEVLMEDFIEPLGITQHKVAVAIGVRAREAPDHGRHGTALRLARYFGTSDLFWVNPQDHYDLEAERDALG